MKTKNLVRVLAVAAVMAIAVLGLVLAPVLSTNAGITAEDGSKKSASCSVDCTAACCAGKGISATNASTKLAGDPASCSISNCSAAGACSFDGTFSQASGDQLEVFKQELATDGQLYDDYPLPEFDAFDLDGNKVKSSDLNGQSTLLVLLVGHCGHSIASLSILKDVAAEYADSDVRVVGVFLNGTKDADKIKLLAGIYSDDYTIWTYPDAALAEVFKTHLAPSYFFIDETGNIKKKLVGLKNADQLKKDVSGLIAQVN